MAYFGLGREIPTLDRVTIGCCSGALEESEVVASWINGEPACCSSLGSGASAGTRVVACSTIGKSEPAMGSGSQVLVMQSGSIVLVALIGGAKLEGGRFCHKTVSD